ncbi:MAG: hypothetical protein L3J73_05505, partial [Thermoplasmata archaeon]|nr:hypothetical protein [Thermoplasmata archaeon]
IARSSAVFLFYDEAGGFWDPIAPPSRDAVGDGFRVPFLAISPWTPPGTIVHATFDPASLLGFVDSNWGLPPLNLRVASSPLPAGLFNFSQAPRAYSGPASPLSFANVTSSLAYTPSNGPRPIPAHDTAREMVGPTAAGMDRSGLTAAPAAGLAGPFMLQRAPDPRGLVAPRSARTWPRARGRAP